MRRPSGGEVVNDHEVALPACLPLCASVAVLATATSNPAPHWLSLSRVWLTGSQGALGRLAKAGRSTPGLLLGNVVPVSFRASTDGSGPTWRYGCRWTVAAARWGGGWNGAKTERDRPGGGRWAHPASAPVGPFAPCCLWFSGPAPGSCPARGAAVPPPYWPRRSTQSGPRAIFSCCARQICATLLPPTTPTK